VAGGQEQGPAAPARAGLPSASGFRSERHIGAIGGYIEPYRALGTLTSRVLGVDVTS
jgi:hypothetical protein